ncbi:unnamed protein product [Gongylonema pulchrum]|uniref:PI4K_N domain-containing protein n=1 Tax=Gongylonema pulchrum TaxID=637853 RepID=A0A183EJ02_9BILA|nr:unnamed protein product [Gongylonema pulchrum]
MASCWISAAQNELGIFQRDSEFVSPLSLQYCSPPKRPYILPHSIWIDFFREMASCWISAAQNELGIFQRDSEFVSPLSLQYCSPPKRPYILPHSIWIDFLAERVDIAKYSSREQLDILELMFVQTLSLTVGPSKGATAATTVSGRSDLISSETTLANGTCLAILKALSAYTYVYINGRNINMYRKIEGMWRGQAYFLQKVVFASPHANSTDRELIWFPD